MQQGPFAEEQTKVSQVQLNTFATAELHGLLCAILFSPWHTFLTFSYGLIPEKRY